MLCNVAAANATSESAAERILSALRVVCTKAYGEHASEFKYDKHLTKQAIAIGRLLKPTKPRYERGADLLQVFKNVQDNRRKNEGGWRARTSEAETKFYPLGTKGFLDLRNNCIFLGRLVLVNRSDDFAKWDPRDEQYFRCYTSDGERIGYYGSGNPGGPDGRTCRLSEDIGHVISCGGYCEVQYLDPKDPRKVGRWSEITTVRPLRPKVMIDASTEHLTTHQDIAYLCFLRTLQHFALVLEKMDLIDKIPWGKFWCHNQQKGPDGRPLCLKACSLANIVKKKLAAANILTAEETETDRGEDTPQRLAGHFLRGHAGSVAYDFAFDGAC